MPIWKRLALIGGITMFVVLLGYTQLPGKQDIGSEALDAESEQTASYTDSPR